MDREEKKLSLLHAVKRPPSKPWKKPAADAAPARVFVVDRHDFLPLVQKLTGAPEASSRRLQEVAPPPLDFASQSEPELEGSGVDDSTAAAKGKASSVVMASTNSMGLLSPSSYLGLCSSVSLLSPGTMASLEHGSVLF